MTLRSKTILGIALIEALALGILIISGLNWLKSSNEKSLEVGSQNLASVFAQASLEAVIATDLAYLDSFAYAVVGEHKLAYIRIVDNDGVELTKQGHYENVDTFSRPFDAEDGVYDVTSEINLDGQTFGTVEMGVYINHIHELLSYATKASFAIAIAEMGLVALFSFALGTYLMRRLDSLREGVLQISQKGPGAKIKLSGNDEVTRVCEAFNLMSKSLAESQNKLAKEYQTQQHLVTKIRQLAEVAEHARDAIIIANPDGQVSWVNPAFESLTGYDLSEVVGKSPGKLLQGENSDPNTIELLSRSVHEKKPVRVEILNYTKSRTSYWVEIELSPVFDDNGDLVRYIAVERDITERVAMESRLSEAVEEANKATQAKSAFLATMSHEIRTPLNGLLGMLQILVDDLKDDEQTKILRLALDSGEHLISILNDILDLSKIENDALNIDSHIFSMNDVLSPVISTYRNLCSEKGLLLILNNNLDDEQVFLGDSVRIRQVLLNLVGNAYKFTHSGSIKVTVSAKSNSFVEISVEDTGIGISDKNIKKIFQEFEQADISTSREYGGTGLGLTICRKLVGLMDGQLTVHSEVEKGSKFSFVIPLPISSTSPSDSNQSYTKELDFSSYQILVTDDNRMNQIVAKAFLEKLGTKVVTCSSGAEAREKLSAGAFNLLIIDNHMPEMNGIETVRKIRSHLHSELIIFGWTADIMQDSTQSFLDAGANEVLTKPLIKSDLINALSFYLRTVQKSA
ncbi:ATP-binding protein (plasmid) [Vibrio scophthalmi]|uniref:ATP-binding protein n=1 Tax=Vibrio scophthalmi TaxID=45658 RepID=UPI003EC13FAF